MRHGRLPSLALLAAAVLATIPATSTAANAADVYGPAAPYTTIHNGQFTFVALPGSALIDKSSYGYVYKAGKQDSHLVVTQVEGGLRFADSGTTTFKSLPSTCRREAVATGVAAGVGVASGVVGSSSDGSPGPHDRGPYGTGATQCHVCGLICDGVCRTWAPRSYA